MYSDHINSRGLALQCSKLLGIVPSLKIATFHQRHGYFIYIYIAYCYVTVCMHGNKSEFLKNINFTYFCNHVPIRTINAHDYRNFVEGASLKCMYMYHLL